MNSVQLQLEPQVLVDSMLQLETRSKPRLYVYMLRRVQPAAVSGGRSCVHASLANLVLSQQHIWNTTSDLVDVRAVWTDHLTFHHVNLSSSCHCANKELSSIFSYPPHLNQTWLKLQLQLTSSNT